MADNHYGTLGADHPVPSGRDVSEQGPLLGKPSNSSPSFSKRFREHMTANVTKSWADALLLCGYAATGLLDSASISIWGAFVSMQTGNSIYLGLGLSHPTAATKWIKSLISIAAFCAGSWSFAAYHRNCGPRVRWVIVTSYFFQLLLIIAAALIVQFGPDAPTDDQSLNWVIVVPLIMLAFQGSGQAITSRALQYSGMTSVVLTTNYCDLFADPQLFTAPLTQNVVRNRRAVAPVVLLGGAVAGGFFAHSDVGLVGALWTAALVKAAVTTAWLVWKEEKEDEQ